MAYRTGINNTIRKKRLKTLTYVFYKSGLELIFTPVCGTREPL